MYAPYLKDISHEEAPFEYGGYPTRVKGQSSSGIWGSLNAPNLGYKRKNNVIYQTKLNSRGTHSRRTNSAYKAEPSINDTESSHLSVTSSTKLMPIDPKKRIGSQSIHQMPQRRERFNEDFDAKSVNKSSTLTQKSLSIFHRVQQAKTRTQISDFRQQRPPKRKVSQQCWRTDETVVLSKPHGLT